MTQHTNTASGAAIKRYKIGYHADEWGQRSSTPSGIPDTSGSWVRYADHVAALAAGQATAAQAVVPSGWNLVPTEPTQAMLDAVVTSMDDFLLGKEAEKQYREDWAAMLAAAPAQPVGPDFFTACAWHEGGGVGGWIALPGYSNETERGVKHLVLEAARKEGYKGTASGRLMELGWEIRPVYLTPQPAQTQAGAVPLTCEHIRAMLNKHPPEDVCGWSYRMGIDDAELHHGIKGGQHGDAKP